MALRGMTTTKVDKYVSKDDPSLVQVKVFHDPADESKGFRMETDVEASIANGATWFELHPIDIFNMGRIYDSSSKVSREAGGDFGFSTRVNETNIEATRMGLADWGNFLAPDGSGDLKFTTLRKNIQGRDYTLASDEALGALGIKLVNELGGEIKRISDVSKAEAKK